MNEKQKAKKPTKKKVIQATENEETGEKNIKTQKPARKKPVPKALRKKVWEKEIGETIKGNCYVCSRQLEFDNFEAGHIVAEANSGETTLDNLKVVCKPCNTSMGTTNLEEFKKTMTSKETPKETSKETLKEIPNELTYDEKFKIIKTNSNFVNIYANNSYPSSNLIGLKISCFGLESVLNEQCKIIASNELKWKQWHELFKVAITSGKKVNLCEDKMWIDEYKQIQNIVSNRENVLDLNR